MRSYLEIYDSVHAGEATQYEHRLAVAILDVADDVAAEDPTTAGHAERIAWATKCAIDPDTASRSMKLMVGTRLGRLDNAEPSDDEIKAEIVAVWNLFAGVSS